MSKNYAKSTLLLIQLRLKTFLNWKTNTKIATKTFSLKTKKLSLKKNKENLPFRLKKKISRRQ